MTVAPSGLLRGHDVFRSVHVGALALCAIMLPWSTAILSMAQMLLVANWLAEGVVRKDLVQRFRRAFTWAPSLLFISFFALHVIGLLWTEDMKWGVDLVRIAFFAAMTVFTVQMMMKMGNYQMTIIDLPMNIVYGVCLFGFAMMAVRSVWVLRVHLQRGYSVLERPETTMDDR